MNRTFRLLPPPVFLISVWLSGLAPGTVPEAAAGHSRWATAGKILTGVFIAEVLHNRGLCAPARPSRVVHERVIVERPAVVRRVHVVEHRWAPRPRCACAPRHVIHEHSRRCRHSWIRRRHSHHFYYEIERPAPCSWSSRRVYRESRTWGSGGCTCESHSLTTCSPAYGCRREWRYYESDWDY